MKFYPLGIALMIVGGVTGSSLPALGIFLFLAGITTVIASVGTDG